ncbi:hypothetical protein A0O34_15175 [Chryseobacterium glaciei]|uniref:Uncharacterized protein n=1 Tax=Chryseobacterium glaciei TaxID=1685010 RepID=A0A172XY71_9FLAO|nr:hypothetical protein [Chryseobacterium glaciei]ANF51765.1 hypothetical protein A0O34_15175 [Chryseobacterium glaciei]
MESPLDFNFKLGSWLNSQQQFFANQNIQEELFNINETVSKIDEFSEKEKDMIKTMSSSFLKLSFIINNNPSKAEKLIQYLQ